MNPLDYPYDIESYPNLFTCVVKHTLSGKRWIFEVSERRSNAAEFYWFMMQLKEHECTMTGFNNIYYDYPVIHHCLEIGPEFTALHAYQKTDQIINHTPFHRRFDHAVWGYKQHVNQQDLMLIHHFDNKAKFTRLKELEFNMQSLQIGDLPVPPGQPVPIDMIDEVIRYNCHDVDETERFKFESQAKIDFRSELTEKYGINMTNFNDTKVGKKFFQMRLEQAVEGICGTFENPRQTPRDQIALTNCILPVVSFEHPEFQRIHNYYLQTVITDTKAAPELKDLSATIDGFDFDFGTGGMHGSIHKQHVKSTPGWKLIDIDVTSFYPMLAIKYKLAPEHLGEPFIQTYEELFNERQLHPKKTPPNEMYKLALNGVYGDSNNTHSPFLDPMYTMKITVNGQLLLCMLAEQVIMRAGGKMVQINTDGITVLVPDTYNDQFWAICRQWEALTGLQLEDAEYSNMWIRDVNNYIAQSTDGHVKRIGDYAHETARENPATREVQWHKDHSALVVKKAAEQHMVYGVNYRDYILAEKNAFEFMIKGKCPASSRFALADGTPVQKTTRFYISTDGQHLFKYMPPLKKTGKTEERRMAIRKGWNVTIAEDMSNLNMSNLNYDWYFQEAEKLIIS